MESQHRWRTGLRYWQEQLAGEPAPLRLGADQRQPSAPPYLAGRWEFIAPASNGNRMAGEQTRLGLIAAFGILLARYSDQKDFCFGLRGAATAAASMPLILRFRTDSCELVDDILRSVDVLVRDGSLHAAVPLAEVLAAQGVPALGNLIQTILAFGVSAELEEDQASRVDLSLHVSLGHEPARCVFVYNAARFEEATIERMARHYCRVLDAVLAKPRHRLADVALLDEQERRQQLVTWNATARPYAAKASLAGLFEAQVARTPDAPAVVYGSDSLGYAELNVRANRLAHYLRAQGVGPETLVGVCLERSLDMLVALVGVLKSGGAFLPLDPAAPPQRLAAMIADARPRLVLSTEALGAQLPAVKLFCLDEVARLEAYPDSNPPVLGKPGNLAYVIYTSGSTGVPKGIGIAQVSAINLAEALARQVYGGMARVAGLRLSMNASFAFDASVKQWLMLLYGACLYPVPEEVRADQDALAHALAAWELDGLDCTPSQLAVLLACAPLRLPRYLLIGGEAVGQAMWDRLQREEGEFFNVYGPTETTVDAAIRRIQDGGSSPVLGRPIANVQIYILDAAQNPVPLGVAGELHIAGAGLARGYLGRAALTAEKFVPNPFSTTPGARMYRTGDLARWQADGEVEYLGRIDHQVKIRGFRIELGEIEAALAGVEGVRDAVVLARPDTTGAPRLVAYLQRAADAHIAGAAELRARLSAVMPEYMVPTQFVVLDRFPLTHNRKIDRAALPLPAPVSTAETWVAPRTPTETVLTAVWREVFKLDRIGIHDDFFALGGHSLLATQILSKLRLYHGIDVPMRQLFILGTIAKIACDHDNRLHDFEDIEI